jgi:hypothetical protein
MVGASRLPGSSELLAPLAWEVGSSKDHYLLPPTHPIEANLPMHLRVDFAGDAAGEAGNCFQVF